MSTYEKRIRQRFVALVADPMWPTVQRLVAEDWRDNDEYWFDDLQVTCIDLCKRLGLPFGPAKCTWCEEPCPEAGDVPDKLGWKIDVDFFCADPPCTPWSRAGKRKGTSEQPAHACTEYVPQGRAKRRVQDD